MTIVHSIDKYLTAHPYITPEGFTSHLYPSGVVRALYIPHQKQYDPYIITDTAYNALLSVFPTLKVGSVYPDIHYHVCYAVDIQTLVVGQNFVATSLIRNSYLTTNGVPVADAIFGDVLIFGSYNHKQFKYDDGHYSIPYEIVEQVFRINEIKSAV